MPTHKCAICKREVEYEGGLPALYPFCSERCRMVDLGKWFREEYSIDRDLAPEDIGTEGFPPASGDHAKRPHDA